MLANVGIERAVVASLCQYGKDALVEIEDIGVCATSFTQTSTQALYTSIKHVLDSNDKIDQAMLLIAIKELGYLPLFDNKKDVEYIGSLFVFPVRKDNIRSFAIKLEKISVARAAILKHQEAIESLEQITGSETIEAIINISESPIFDLIVGLNKSKDSGPHLLFKDIEEIVEHLRNNPCDNIGVPTPWKNYNYAIGGGLRRGGVNLLASRPKGGKSTLAKEAILHYTTKLKIPALMLDTEMVRKDQLIRSLASVSEVALSRVESGRFAENHIESVKIDRAVKQLKDNKYYWHESIAGKPFDEILAIIRRWIVKEVGYDDNGQVNNCVVVYDYFKLMDSAHLQNLKEYEAMGYQISRLTDFCKEFDFPCLAFVQLNRQNDISQSDRLRWLCHSYSAFAKKEPQETIDDGAENGNRKLTVLDTRFGPGISDGDYICFNFNRDINKITEIGLKSNIGKNPTKDTGFKSEIVSSSIVEPPRIEYNDDEAEVPWEENESV